MAWGENDLAKETLGNFQESVCLCFYGLEWHTFSCWPIIVSHVTILVVTWT